VRQKVSSLFGSVLTLLPALGMLLGLLMAGAPGCGSAERSSSGAGAYRGAFAEVFDGGASPEAGKPWAILLGVYSGEDAMSRAEGAASRLRSGPAGLSSARAVPREKGGAVVLFGGYDSSGERSAQRDLERVKGLVVDGARPFRGAFLTPQGGRPEGSNPELDLNQARQRHGRGAEYTLQVAVYQSEQRSDAMRAAEEAALELRREGDLAFYYHGPTRSMVTVGLFGERDFDPETGRRSAELQRLQERFPNNLLNGRTIIERRMEGERTQPSTLVRVPGGD